MADDAATQAPATVSVTIDGKQVDARPGEMVIAAAERAGVYIPRFCYHPRLEPVGMCRMCLVNIDSGRGPALQPACVIPVADGMVVDTQAANVAKAQDGVLEFLLINHPLDCPVCDKGGECPLQDQTYAFGPGESRFVEEKRHYEKPIPISDLVYLDRERCILCDRCTRFAKDVAGDPLISFTERGNDTQILTFPDEPFASYFSGNTVQLCPVGALTAAPYRFRARPWDLDQTESTCTTCAVGCRVAVQSSQNEVIRLVGVDVDPVNHGWLCDKGRFGYEALRHEGRITGPRLRRDGALAPAPWPEALDAAAAGIRAALDAGGPSSVAVIGGSRLANEDAYAWARLAKSVIGTDNVDAQLDDGLPAEVVLGVPRATIDEACSADVVIVLGPDLKEELPVLHLRLRAAAVDGDVQLVEIAPGATGLSRHAAVTLHHRPGTAADVARALRSGGAADAAGVGAAEIAAARDLLGLSSGTAKRVVCVVGRSSVAESADLTVDAAAVLVDAIEGLRFLPALRRGNVAGALDMGLAPGILPGRVGLDDGRDWFTQGWGSVPAAPGLDTAGILRAAADGRIGALVLLGADPLVDVPDRALAREALAAARFVVAVDLFETASVAEADVVLPATAPHEKRGTTTNVEGRISRLGKQVTAPGTVWDDWMIAVELGRRLGGALPFTTTDELWTEIEHLCPSHQGITAEVLASAAWRDGVPVPMPSTAVTIARPAGGIEKVEGESRPADSSGETETPEVAAVENSPTHASTAIADHHEGELEVHGEPAANPAESGATRPTPLVWTPQERHPEVPAPGGYALRLVAGRKLYDGGAFVSRCGSMAHLAPGRVLGVSDYDAERLGVGTGDRVRVQGRRWSGEYEVRVDRGVPRGAARIAFAQPGEGAADLIDAGAIVNDVQVENL